MPAQRVRRHGAGTSGGRGGQFRSHPPPEPVNRDMSPSRGGRSQASVIHVGPADDSVAVSRVLNMINKPGVTRWQLGKVAECAVDDVDAWADMTREAAYKYILGAADRARTTATTSGTSIHSQIENLLAADAEPPDPAEKPHLAAAHAFLTRFRESIESASGGKCQFRSEVDVCSTSGGYHGRADLLVFGPDDQWHIIDWKTTDKLEAKGPYGDSSLQLSAYGHADGWRRPGSGWEPLPDSPAASAWVVQLKPDGTYIAAECMSDDSYDAFLGVQRMAAWTQKTRRQTPFADRWSNAPDG